MTESYEFTPYTIRQVAIVNGDDFERPLPYWYAEMVGFQTVHVSQSLRSKEEVVEFIQSNAQAAICVHRLGDYPFSGAELVATLYDLRIPALLVTQYTEIDAHSSIRRWRDKVPVMMHLRDFDPDTLREYLIFCMVELQGHIPTTRVPYRVLVGVINVESELGEKYVNATVDCWDHYRVVRFPIELISQELRAHAAPDAWFFAHVNVKAHFQEDLYFRCFELAPEPEYEENLTYCVNVLDGTGDSGFGEEDALRRFMEIL